MIGEYTITDYGNLGLPCIEVTGDTFYMQDLYEIIGKAGYMATFRFHAHSEAYRTYGSYITGLLFISFKTSQVLDGDVAAHQTANLSSLRIDSYDDCIDVEKKKRLKYRGVALTDLESFSYFPNTREIERHPSGKKKVPNIVHIRSDFPAIDENILLANYLISKNNSGYELIKFEKDQLLGTLLGTYERIDRRILDHFQYSDDDVHNSLHIRLAYLKAKSKRAGLNADEKRIEKDLKAIYQIETLTIVAGEMQKAGLNKNLTAETQEVLKEIIRAANDFTPEIVLHRKRQIYLDVRSYVHIVMRHLKDFQIGKFQTHTPLPYKPRDLSNLIEKVLERIADEIESHFKSEKSAFRRSGEMAVQFNNDYFHLIIEPDGRLSQFHSVANGSC